jgi:hypothetical protein
MQALGFNAYSNPQLVHLVESRSPLFSSSDHDPGKDYDLQFPLLCEGQAEVWRRWQPLQIAEFLG